MFQVPQSRNITCEMPQSPNAELLDHTQQPLNLNMQVLKNFFGKM